MDRIQTTCFLLSYAVALGLELLYLLRPRPVLRLAALVCGGAGLVAHTLYLAGKQPPLAWQFGWMLFLAWVLAIFYLYGAIHHGKQAWGVFALPLVLALAGIGVALKSDRGAPERDDRFWGLLHGGLLFLAAIGICVGFLASLMYLLQAHRLKAKLPPGRGLRLLSLERLEAMNRRAILLVFPLLTAGVLLGAALMTHYPPASWTDPRVLSAVVLWLSFALTVYLRYGRHLRGRQMAVLTIVNFALMLACLSLAHPVGRGDVPPSARSGGQP
jgi:ABC-type transport system involved in cytochrome c biogenesis permease subunit